MPEHRYECPNCGRVTGFSNGVEVCDNCGWRADDEQVLSLFDVVSGPAEPAPRPEPYDGLVDCPQCRGTGKVPYLPVPSAPARTGDPETSHDAAARHHQADVGRFSEKSIKAPLLREYARGYGLTHFEAASNVCSPGEFHSRVETARRRVGDLSAVGFVADTGKRRTNPGARAESIVWQIAPAGAVALERLERQGWTR